MKKILIFALMILSILLCKNVYADIASGMDNANGNENACYWFVNDDGSLIIRPRNNNDSCVLDNDNSNSWRESSIINQIKTIEIRPGVKAPNNAQRLFQGMTNVTSADISNLDTSDTTSMFRMFSEMKSLTSLDLSSLKTSNVVDMAYMFADNSSLTSINISGFDTYKVQKLNYMFSNVSKVTTLDASSLKTPNATTMENMFYNCKSLGYLNISNLDTTNVKNMNSMFNSMDSLNKIAIGDKTNFHIDEPWGATFGRGTWEDEFGNPITATDIHIKSATGIAGTYTKISDLSNQIDTDYAIHYEIGKVTKIDEIRHGGSSFILSDNKDSILIKIDKGLTGDITMPDYVEFVIKDAVKDPYGNTYNLVFKIDNIRYYDLYETTTQDLYNPVIYLNGNINYNLYYYKNLTDYNNKKAIKNEHSAKKQDVNTWIEDKDGNIVEGNYEFSIHDLDIASTKDKNEGYSDGYQNYSEGINVTSGLDTDKAKISDKTFIKTLDDSGRVRYTGSKADNDTEFSEVIMKADAKSIKYTYTVSDSAGTILNAFSNLAIVELEKLSDNGKILSGAVLKIYNANTGSLLHIWITDNNNKKVFLPPGKYKLVESQAPDGYQINEAEVLFEISFELKLIRDDMVIDNNKITLINTYVAGEGGDTLGDDDIIVVPLDNEVKPPKTGDEEDVVYIITLLYITLISCMFIIKKELNN